MLMGSQCLMPIGQLKPIWNIFVNVNEQIQHNFTKIDIIYIPKLGFNIKEFPKLQFCDLRFRK